MCAPREVLHLGRRSQNNHQSPPPWQIAGSRAWSIDALLFGSKRIGIPKVFGIPKVCRGILTFHDSGSTESDDQASPRSHHLGLSTGPNGSTIRSEERELATMSAIMNRCFPYFQEERYERKDSSSV
jgi:hypothetical protein